MPMSRTGSDFLVEQAAPGPGPDEARWKRWTDIIARLRERWRRLLVWALVAGTLAGLASIRLCKYQATAQIMPPDSSSGNPMASLSLQGEAKSNALGGLAGFASDILGLKSTGAIFIKVLQSRTVQDKLIDRFNLQQRYHMAYKEDARAKLATRTIIDEDKKSGIISISYKDTDPQFAAALASAYVEELDHVMLQVATSAARREREFIEKRLTEEKATLDEAEKSFSQFASNNLALDVPEQTRVMVESGARLQGELIAAQAELDSLHQIYTDDNIRVKSAQAKVNELQRALNNLNTGVSPRSERNASNPYPSVKSLPLVGLKWQDLYRDTKIHETVYELLTQQYEVARIQEAREIPTVKVLDQAVVPERRHPAPALVIAVGVLAGLLLASVGQILQYRWENWDPYDPRRVFLSSILRRHPTSAIPKFPDRA